MDNNAARGSIGKPSPRMKRKVGRPSRNMNNRGNREKALEKRWNNDQLKRCNVCTRPWGVVCEENAATEWLDEKGNARICGGGVAAQPAVLHRTCWPCGLKWLARPCHVKMQEGKLHASCPECRMPVFGIVRYHHRSTSLWSQHNAASRKGVEAERRTVEELVEAHHNQGDQLVTDSFFAQQQVRLLEEINANMRAVAEVTTLCWCTCSVHMYGVNTV